MSDEKQAGAEHELKFQKNSEYFAVSNYDRVAGQYERKKTNSL